MYKLLLRPLLFLMEPEKAHHTTFRLLKMACQLPGGRLLLSSIFKSNSPQLATRVFGIDFPSRVGLAAGLDKNALVVDEMACLGFGFIELGTATPLPQSGNDQPRLFRLPADKALINRMGFNNDGASVIAARLGKRKSKVIVGGNIGKNKITPNEKAADDYVKCFEQLYPVVDYFTVNVSSPNTPGLRALQEKQPLKDLLNLLQEKNNASPRRKPILLKIAPDLTNEQLDDIVEIVAETKIDGVIATNTTISREQLPPAADSLKAETGGLSGAPLTRRSTEVMKYLNQKSSGSFPIMASGGIMNADDALEKLKAGAVLVQVYTGFIYEGPGLIKEINQKIQSAGI